MPPSTPPSPADPWHTPAVAPQPPAAGPAFAVVGSAPAGQAADAPGYAAAGYFPAPGQPGAFSPGMAGPWQMVAPPPPTSLRGLGIATAIALVLQVVLGLVVAGVSAWGVLSWSRVSGAPATMSLAPDVVQTLLMLVRAPLYIVTVVLFMCWLFTATKNARNAGARVRHSPAWAVFAWMVPVISLWWPKQMVDDVWRASMPGVSPGTDLRHVRKPSLVMWWWTAFMVAGALPVMGTLRAFQANLGPNVIAAAQGRPAPVEVDFARVHETAALWNLWGAVVLTIAAGLAVVIVRRVSRWQDDRTDHDAAAARAAWTGVAA